MDAPPWAKALGYRPNLAARTLATGRSGIYGLIVPSRLMGDVYGAQLVSAVTDAVNAPDIVGPVGNDHWSAATSHATGAGPVSGRARPAGAAPFVVPASQR